MIQKTVNNNILYTSVDSIFFNFWLNKIITRFMFDGKRLKSENLIYFVIYYLNSFSISIFSFFECLDIIKPAIELISKRIGRRFYKVPTPLSYQRQLRKAVFWFFKAIFSSNFKNINSIFISFIFELQNILYLNQSFAISECLRIHSQGIYSRTYTHWRWK